MISAGCPQDLLRRTCTRKNFTRISTRSSHKELCKIMPGPLGEESSRISTRSSHKGLHKITQEPLRKDYIRISTRASQKDNRFVRACAIEMHMDMSQEPFHARIYR